MFLLSWSTSMVIPSGLYASFLKGQGYLGRHFLLDKGHPIWNLQIFTRVFFRAPRDAMTRGHRGNRLHCLLEVSVLYHRPQYTRCYTRRNCFTDRGYSVSPYPATQSVLSVVWLGDLEVFPIAPAIVRAGDRAISEC